LGLGPGVSGRQIPCGVVDAQQYLGLGDEAGPGWRRDAFGIIGESFSGFADDLANAGGYAQRCLGVGAAADDAERGERRQLGEFGFNVQWFQAGFTHDGQFSHEAVKRRRWKARHAPESAR
jgi:hypothetical protein